MSKRFVPRPAGWPFMSKGMAYLFAIAFAVETYVHGFHAGELRMPDPDLWCCRFAVVIAACGFYGIFAHLTARPIREQGE
jgi:hypothetical protein